MADPAVAFAQVTPILRIFSLKRAHGFYVGYLGMTEDWRHRFDADAPVYLQVSRDGLVLHLSEHHGDCCPGSTVLVRMRGLRSFHAEISAKRYPYMRPGIEAASWGDDVVEVIDPFGNRLRFTETAS